MEKIRRVLVSLYRKEGSVEFVRFLAESGAEILSTGGTYKLLKESGIPATMISDYTGFPEILDGRVKTLHPKIHGGLLGKREDERHLEQMAQHGIEPIDMLVVNLYPFEDVVSRKGHTLEEAIENIDIGGPAMIRSAAKNYSDVVVVVDPADYPRIMGEMRENHGAVKAETRLYLARKAFNLTSGYDASISSYLNSLVREEEGFPSVLNISCRKEADLRYGENPHQRAALYSLLRAEGTGLVGAAQLHGKDLSYNNLLDLDAALRISSEFDSPAAVVIKHTNPCGAALGASLREAFATAWNCDPVSAFGSVVGLNRRVDEETAEEMGKYFIEAIIVPGFKEGALKILKRSKNVRLIERPGEQGEEGFNLRSWDIRGISGGLLIQDKDRLSLSEGELEVVTKRKPTQEESEALDFGWRVVKHVKSNAVLFCTPRRTVGIGAGQMSRVDSVRLAVMKAGGKAEGTVLASDAFFPFRDGVDTAAEAGATAIIQPGGSIRDQEVIAAADEREMAMVFTGVRHFRH